MTVTALIIRGKSPHTLDCENSAESGAGLELGGNVRSTCQAADCHLACAQLKIISKSSSIIPQTPALVPVHLICGVRNDTVSVQAFLLELPAQH